jgi:hypothetical protein
LQSHQAGRDGKRENRANFNVKDRKTVLIFWERNCRRKS